MLTLHDYLPSLNGWKVRALLGLLRIPYQSQPVSIFAGGSRTETFLAMNPGGAIPVLELEDGRTLAESNAILTYLAAETRFLARGQVLPFQGNAMAGLRSPADASPIPSRVTAHGLAPMRIATPSSRRTLTAYSLPVSRRTSG